jgi:hypothetical protein
MNYIYIIFLLLCLPTGLLVAQTAEIETILNIELQREIQHQQEDSENYRGEIVEVAENFKIENGVLSVTFRKKSYYSGEDYLERKEVELNQITLVEKDLQVVFSSEIDAVKIIRTTGEKIDVSYDNLFLTHLSIGKYNEFLADELVAAFKKAGYTIEKGEWMD